MKKFSIGINFISIVVLVLTFLMPINIFAQSPVVRSNWLDPSDKSAKPTFTVGTFDEFSVRIKNLKPGDILEVKDSIWRDKGRITIVARGTKDRPVTIRTRRTGGVVFEGYTNILLAGSYLRLEGFTFKGLFTPPIRNVKAIGMGAAPNYCDHCLVDSITMRDYYASNPSDYRQRTSQIVVNGQWNRISHSVFDGKQNRGNMIVIIGSSSFADNTLIDRNCFANRPNGFLITGQPNGFEAVTVGVGASFNDSSARIESNLFYRVAGEAELMTLKGSGIVVRDNTFTESGGSISLRTSDASIVEHNIFYGNNIPETGGVRIIGNDHVVVHNIFQRLNSNNKPWAYPISVYSGYLNYANTTGMYKPVERATIAFNSFAYNDANWIIGGKAQIGAADAEPRGVLFAYNGIFGNSNLQAVQASAASQVQYKGNLCDTSITAPGVCSGSTSAVQINSLYVPSGVTAVTVPDRRAYSFLNIPMGMLTKLKYLNMSPGQEIPFRMLTRSDVGPLQ